MEHVEGQVQQQASPSVHNTAKIALLKEAGFKLRKWCANHRQLLQDIPQDDQEVNLDFENASIKALGLIWSPASDQFCLRANLQPVSVITKRSVISDVARIYDPLGIAGPVVVAAKIFIQQLWEDQISWDDELPEDRKTKWHAFRNALNMLDNTHIPRHVFDGQTAKHIQMHVFVDASERAYGAAIYIRSKLPNKRIIVRLLCAKSRVAPLQRVSLPRLELCAALLGAELANKTKNELRYEDKQLFFWSDSEIVLHWINSASSSLKTFVANRISKIQELTINSQWRHVDSKNNPADLISRGLKPEQLPECNMWFYGPLFLHGNEDSWPKEFAKELHPTSELEFKRKPVIVTTATQMGLERIIYKINHRNSFDYLQRVVAYIQRFIKNSRTSSADRPATKVLSPIELTSALHLIVKTIQSADFKDDINKLKTTKELSRSSPIISLSPFLDKSDILRVGGRLDASNLSYEMKHQIILPYNDPIVKLILVMLHGLALRYTRSNRCCSVKSVCLISD
ncbi:uncharacterized protein LOC142224970 [Haematobia irritans]|uniref:uncharacterized protein LOC142224970 n=1 Tax=Haematobia irritans TaxID=7368 RepID=UPI003F50B103